MVESRDLPQRIEHLVERAQDEMLEASHHLVDGFTKRPGRVVPSLPEDAQRLVDDVFEFAERVLRGQRRMVQDMVEAITEETRRAGEAGRQATGRVSKKASEKKAAGARRSPAKKKAGAKRASGNHRASLNHRTPRRTPARATPS